MENLKSQNFNYMPVALLTLMLCQDGQIEKKNHKCGTSIHTEIISGQRAVVECNRDYLKKIIEVTLFLARQGISFRAHREDELSLNKGYLTIYLY